ARLGPRELGDERTHCRAITAGAREHEVEALLGDRKEPERAIARDDVDGDAEVGAALRDGCGDGVVAGGLDGVARRPRAPEEAVDQDSRAAPAVAVHHDDTGRRGHGAHGFLHGLALEARVPRPEHHPLHAPVAGDELETGLEERGVVRARRGIEEVDAGQIALAPLHGGEAALAADRDRLAGHARRTEAPQEHVETDAVAADDDQVDGRGSRSAAGDDIPASARTTGATNSWNVKMADVGKPGRTTMPFLPLAARQIGLPGLRATPCTRMPGGPSTSSSTRTLRSPGPFDVPPERTTRSAQPSARRSVERIASASSGTMPRGNGSPPSSRTASQIITALESKICPAAIGAPGCTISSPVENTATTGFLKTETRGM